MPDPDFHISDREAAFLARRAEAEEAAYHDAQQGSADRAYLRALARRAKRDAEAARLQRSAGI